MPSAFQRAATNPCANMFSFNIFVCRTEMRLELSPNSLSLDSFLLSWATSFCTCMTATVKVGFTHAETLRSLDISLMANSHRGGSTTLALNWHTAGT